MFPCDTRLEAFPPYLSRVSSLTRLLFWEGGKKLRMSGLSLLITTASDVVM